MRWNASRLWLTVLSLLLLTQCITALLVGRSTPVAQSSKIQLRRHTSLALNRIFCEHEELQPPLYHQDEQQLQQIQQEEQSRMVHFPKADYRFEHIRDILKLKPGDNLKIGVLDVGCTDAAEIISMNEESGVHIAIGIPLSWKSNPRPQVDLILAVPRPLRLERILPVVSCIGVHRLILVGASKVQADYFGSHLFRRPLELRKGLVEGLSQAASDCHVPHVLVRKNLRKWIESDEFEALYHAAPHEVIHKLIAHPPSETLPLIPVRMASLPHTAVESVVGDLTGSIQNLSRAQRTLNDAESPSKIVIAIGPEGGWEDEEVLLFVSKGFQLCTLGDRILRTDMAVPVILGLAHDWVNNDKMETTQ